MTQMPRTLLLTDAAHFIGPAVIKLMAARDVTIVASDPSFHDQAVVEALEAEHPRVIAIAQTTPAETVALALTHVESIDALCTGGVLGAAKTVAGSLKADVTRPFFEALVIEPLAYVALVADAMKAQGHGRIVFVTSAGPIGGIPNYTAYAAARAALNGAVRSLSMELAPSGISVNAVAPNFIATEAYFPKALIEDPATRAKILSRVPAKRFGDPMEAAETVAFFALGNSGFVTGQVLAISGGWS
ncbi:MAG: SDR family oxidoreductase [Parvibaculum sp.]|nr:SDR family oxidoreductase [Parvibaculum sp.]